jgi:hypothetical protein
MIVKLDSGKELTMEEVKEIVEKFGPMFAGQEKIYVPVPYPSTPGFVQPWEPIGPSYTVISDPNASGGL